MPKGQSTNPRKSPQMDMVLFTDVEPLLNLLLNKSNIEHHAAIEMIGYKAGAQTLATWRKEEFIPKRALFGIKGLIADLQVSASGEKSAAAQMFHMTYDEAVLMYDILRRHRANALENNNLKTADKYKGLLTRVLTHMHNLGE